MAAGENTINSAAGGTLHRVFWSLETKGIAETPREPAFSVSENNAHPAANASRRVFWNLKTRGVTETPREPASSVSENAARSPLLAADGLQPTDGNAPTQAQRALAIAKRHLSRSNIAQHGCNIACTNAPAAPAQLNRAIDDGAALQEAIDQNDLQAINFLLKYKKKLLSDRGVSLKLPNGYTLLQHAVITGHLKIVKYFCETLNMDAQQEHDSEGKSLLHLAAQYNHSIKVAEYLVESGAKITRTSTGWTPLHLAAREGNIKMVEYLKGLPDIEIDACTKDNWTSLHIAAHCGHLQVVESLYAAGAKVNAHTAKERRAPLHLATQNGHLPIVQFLSKLSEVDVNASDKNGWPPFHIAVYYGHLAVAQCIAASGRADVNARNSDSCTPLYVAAQNGHLPAVQFLLELSEIDVNASNEDGWAPLHIAAQNGHLAVARCLVANRADVNARGSKGCTPFYIAAQNGHSAVIQCIAASGRADVNACNSEGCTPFYIAAQNGHLPAVQVLSKFSEVDVNASDKKGWTALHITAQEGHLSCFQYISEFPGTDVNARNLKDCTPLHIAAYKGHLSIVQYSAGAPGLDLNTSNESDWRRALSYALKQIESRVHISIAQFLMREKKLTDPELYKSNCLEIIKRNWLTALHEGIPATVACGTVAYNQIPEAVGAKAREIRDLKKSLGTRPLQGNPLFDDPITLQLMEIPVFDVSHPAEQHNLPALQRAFTGWTEEIPLTNAQRNALNEHQNRRHYIDLDSFKALEASNISNGSPTQCLQCRLPEGAGQSISIDFLRVDTDLQDQILAFLRAKVERVEAAEASAAALQAK